MGEGELLMYSGPKVQFLFSAPIFSLLRTHFFSSPQWVRRTEKVVRRTEKVVRRTEKVVRRTEIVLWGHRTPPPSRSYLVLFPFLAKSKNTYCKAIACAPPSEKKICGEYLSPQPLPFIRATISDHR